MGQYYHFPLQINLEQTPESNLSFVTATSNDDLNSSIDYDKLEKMEYNNGYNQMIVRDMKIFCICLNVGCTCDLRCSLNLFHLKLITSLKKKSSSELAQRNKTKGLKKTVRGWKKFCKKNYIAACKDFFIWLEHEKIRSGTTYERVKSTRTIFQKTLKHSQFEGQRIRDVRRQHFKPEQNFSNKVGERTGGVLSQIKVHNLIFCNFL